MPTQGIVPSALLEQIRPRHEAWLLARCITAYLHANAVPRSDVPLLDTERERLAPNLSTDMLNYDWAEGWIG